MSTNFAKGKLSNLVLKNESKPTVEKIDYANLNFISINNNNSSREISVKLSEDEVRRGYEYQKIMLNFAYVQYKKSEQKENHEQMKRFYNEALADYNIFREKYKDIIEKL